MAFTTMHFATGMACSGLVYGAGCLVLRRGWRWLPLVMTAGGMWAIMPDMPRIFREDFPSLPLASVLGRKELERSLHDIGDLFFFHKRLDAQPHEYALHGLIGILLLYNASIVMLMWLIGRAKRHGPGSNNDHRNHRGAAGTTATAEKAGDSETP